MQNLTKDNEILRPISADFHWSCTADEWSRNWIIKDVVDTICFVHQVVGTDTKQNSRNTRHIHNCVNTRHIHAIISYWLIIRMDRNPNNEIRHQDPQQPKVPLAPGKVLLKPPQLFFSRTLVFQDFLHLSDRLNILWTRGWFELIRFPVEGSRLLTPICKSRILLQEYLRNKLARQIMLYSLMETNPLRIQWNRNLTKP